MNILNCFIILIVIIVAIFVEQVSSPFDDSIIKKIYNKIPAKRLGKQCVSQYFESIQRCNNDKNNKIGLWWYVYVDKKRQKYEIGVYSENSFDFSFSDLLLTRSLKLFVKVVQPKTDMSIPE